MSSNRYSGHETFHCRHFWLKKGHDFIKDNKDFKNEDAVVNLGVGKNMVTSINHWLLSFGLLENSKLTRFSFEVFDNDGYDPYLEDIATMWLLHYNLLSIDYSSIYKIVFEEFRKSRVSSEFTAKKLYNYLDRKLKIEGVNLSQNTIENDIKVFLKNYISVSKKGDKNIEDDFTSVLIGLKLISSVPDTFIDGEQVFVIEYNTKNNLDPLIFLFAILDTFRSQISISVDDIQIKVSDLFLCNREGTEEKLLALQELGFLVYKEDAGRKEIQFKTELDKWNILKNYYERSI